MKVLINLFITQFMWRLDIVPVCLDNIKIDTASAILWPFRNGEWQVLRPSHGTEGTAETQPTSATTILRASAIKRP